MKKIVSIVLVTIVIIVGIGYFLGYFEKEKLNSTKQPIKIGWVGPLTGEIAAIGKDALVSAQIATEEVNKDGGVNGRTLELVVEDGKCNPKDGANAGNKLMNIDKVSVIMPTCSPELLSMASLANEKKIVLLSSCASAPKITESGEYVFRTYPSDSFQGTFGAEYAFRTLGKRKVAILSIENDWGSGISEAFKKKFEALGGSVVLIEKYSPETQDLKSQLAKIKEANPDLFYFAGFTQGTLIGLKQAKDIGLTVPILGGDAWDDPTIHKESVSEGIMYTMPKAQYHQDWSEKMKARGANTTTCAPAAYDNVKILSEIMKRVGPDPEKIKQELYKVKEYNGVNGIITIDQNGDLATAEYDVKVVSNGKATIK